MNIVEYTFNLVWCFICTILHCICYLTALLLFKVDLNHVYTLKIFFLLKNRPRMLKFKTNQAVIAHISIHILNNTKRLQF